MERSTAAQAAGVFLVTLAAGLPLAIRAGDWLAGDGPPAPPPAQGQHIESRLGEAPAAERPVPGGWSGEREPDAVTSAAATAP
ncbi:MAG TPA: hypothetical protein VES42_06355, partial [Pilimelia sp.]|nr:hypothetical protein [Pilimelia sp.]